MASKKAQPKPRPRTRRASKPKDVVPAPPIVVTKFVRVPADDYALPFWRETHKLLALIQEQFPNQDTIFITSIDRPYQSRTGWRGGVVFEANPKLAALRCAEETHRLSTPEETESYRAAKKERESSSLPPRLAERAALPRPSLAPIKAGVISDMRAILSPIQARANRFRSAIHS